MDVSLVFYRERNCFAVCGPKPGNLNLPLALVVDSLSFRLIFGGLGAVPKPLTRIVVFPENPENGQVLKSAGSIKQENA